MASDNDNDDHDNDHAGDENQAVVIHGARDVRVESRPAPTPTEGTARVAVRLGGICGSDLSYYRKGAVGDFVVKRPMILGHEVVGTVAAAGVGVPARLEGERVAVDPSSPCGRCDRCREGRPNVCLEPTFLGSASTDPHVDGGFTGQLLTGRVNLVPLADDLAWADAVFAEPLAVNVHALNRAGSVVDRRVLVIGAGPIGAIAAAAAHRYGAAEVTVTDLAAERLTLAAAVGADTTVVAEEFVAGADFDVVIEASGSAPGIGTALSAVRKGGTVVLIGLPQGGPIAIPVGLTVGREIDVLGSFRFCHDEFRTAVELLSDGFDLSPLLTDTFAATDAPDAFVRATESAAMKVQLDFGSTP
ncbi:MAG: alcohol dehydrogenase catalytic domain-containing protein [Actinomycetota bacterium]